MDLVERVAQLEAMVSSLVAEHVRLREENAGLLEENARLKVRVAELEERLGRNSQNSSMPPSSDDAAARAERAKRASQRPASKRKRGGQAGRRGSTLVRVADPDRVVVHRPTACSGCGDSLDAAVVVSRRRRQVFDLVEQPVEVSEHQALVCRCACGTATAGTFPAEASAPAVWGPRVAAFAVYLVIRHHVPYKRAAELLRSFGAAVSVGWIAAQVTRAAAALGAWLATLRARLAAAVVVHADETSARVAQTTWWFHVASTDLLTLLVAHPNRGHAAITAAGVLTTLSGVLVHDRAAAYWNYATAHQVCVAHLLRDLAGIATSRRHQLWAEQLRHVLLDAKTACDDARTRGDPALEPAELADIHSRYRHAVADALDVVATNINPAGVDRSATNLAIAFFDHQHDILAFCHNLAVPFDNNQAERDLRMTKIAQKIHYGWQTPAGAQRFAAIRSYLETARKHHTNPYTALHQLFTTGPWPIPHTT